MEAANKGMGVPSWGDSDEEGPSHGSSATDGVKQPSLGAGRALTERDGFLM